VSVFDAIQEVLTGDEVIVRARSAQVLLDDPTLSAALKEAEEGHLQRWASTGPEDTREREDCWSAVRGVESVRAVLRSFIADGEVVQAQLRGRQ